MEEDRQRELRLRGTLNEHVFQSRVPFVAWFRSRWNEISTRWYVRPLIEQQNQFNQALLDELRHLHNVLAQVQSRLDGLDAQIDVLTVRIDALTVRTNDAGLALEDIDVGLVDVDRAATELRRDLARVTMQVSQIQRQASSTNRPHENRLL